MSLKVCARAGAVLVLVAGVAAVAPVSAEAQTTPTFKVAWFNIQSGRGEPAMAGHTSTFADTLNCTDPTQPLNAWGVGKIQKELIDKIGNDPKMVAFGLGEAWFCGTEGNVQKLLGWKAKAGNQNGVTMVAKYGFAGPQEWVQLDTSLNPNPADTMWVLRVPVCLDAACSQSINIFASHWYSSGTNKIISYDKQAAQTVAFLQRAGGATPHILIGDLNVWDGTTPVCNGENPTNIGLQRLRDAGYLDAWPLLHGTAEGFTGMTNRVGCGSPEGYVYKRPDYTWSPSTYQPVSISRFGVVPPGDEAPSDHYGLITEFPFPGPAAIADQVPPTVWLMSPTEGQTFTGGSLTISASASDDVGVRHVDIVEDGVVTASLTSAPYQKSSNLASIDGNHTIEARAFDAAGNVASDLRHISVTTSPPVVSPSGEIVLYAKNASTIVGNWKVVADAQAAGGARMWNPDAGAAKLAAALATPANYFELTFDAEAGRAYRIWMRGRADADYWGNDSVWVQFSGAVTATGAPAYRIGTTEGTWVGIEDCSGCGVLGWGWNDNGYGVLGPLVYFAAGGTHTIRIQQREDGISLDQVVLSPQLYLTNAPGAPKQDGTILPLTTSTAPAPPPPTLSTTEIVMFAKNASALAGNWMSIADSTAADGTAVGTADAGAAKVAAASASPASYVEFTFQADAGKPYHLWIRGRAERDSWANDSVFVQFSGSIDSAGNPVARMGSTSSYVVNLEDDANLGVSGWGWQDNGYGAGVMGSAITFQASGTQTIRIQTREDGFRLDQIVLSSQTYLNSSPGALKNDTTILR